MKIYDISRSLQSAEVYPGDPAPKLERIKTIGEDGSVYNLTAFYACCHNATHIDAPLHFIEDGATTQEIPLERMMGKCTVISASGILTGEHMDQILPYCEENILFKGNGKAFLSASAAFALADAGINLVGTDSQSIAPPNETARAHVELLARGLVILEGLDLSEVPDGNYYLTVLPLKIEGVEGAPARAILISSNE
ncbi:MAG: cyclase family protein [Clostridia bacterium]|nr:cyclase family protein [Clostridia bacterium]